MICRWSLQFVLLELFSPDFKYMRRETLTVEGGMGLRP